MVAVSPPASRIAARLIGVPGAQALALGGSHARKGPLGPGHRPVVGLRR
ncbi:hypothetical protein [Deinococcus hopiensis]|nr:hypothetical protein [Deinococcus hopiensis]